MKINFQKIKFKNILSYGNNLTEFEFKNGLDLIVSKNGSGKSTLIEAIFFCLFGKPFRKIKLGSLINNINNKELYTEIDFEISGNHYNIRRGLKPNIFEIRINDKILNQTASIKDNQEYLENSILMMSETTFRQLILIGANNPISKSFLELSLQEREEVFQIVSDIQIFQNLKIKIKEKLQKIKTDLAETNYKIEILSESLSNDKISYNLMKEKNEKIKNQTKFELEEQIKQHEEKLKNLQIEFQKKQKLRDQYQIIKNERRELEETLQKIEKGLKKLQTIIVSAETKKQQFKHCFGCEKLSNLIDVSEIEKLDEYIEKQKKLELKKIEFQNKLNKKTDEFYSLKEELLKLETILKDINETQNNLEKIKLNLEKVSIEDYFFDYSLIEKKEKELEILKQQEVKLKISKSKYERLEDLIFSEKLKGVVINNSLPKLNKFINEYLELFSDVHYNVYLTKELKEVILIRNEIKEFHSLSNGEKMRVSFAILFAFHKLIETKNSISTNILFLDEILDASADSFGRIELLNILKSEFIKTKDVIIISHSQEITSNDSEFDRIITIKKDPFSKLRIEEK